MMRMLLVLCGVVLAIVAVSMARGDRSYGIGRFWDLVGGKVEQEQRDWSALRRSRSGNDALICPPGLCGVARVDARPPIFLAAPDRLREALDRLLAEEPDTVEVFRSADGLQVRVVVRSHWLRFPDLVDLRVVDLGGERATLALYSTSRIGLSDLGVNRARLDRWLATLASALPMQPQALATPQP